MSAPTSSTGPAPEEAVATEAEVPPRAPFDWILFGRRAFAAAGLALLAYGVAKLFLVVSLSDLFLLLLWMIGAVVIHDGVLTPLVLALGAGLSRVVPDRGRRYVQGALVTGAMVVVVALPMIYLEGSQPPAKAILLQHYGVNLTVVLALVAAVSFALYALRVARDRRTGPEVAVPAAPADPTG